MKEIKKIDKKDRLILHEFGSQNPMIHYTNGKQSYIGIVNCFVIDENKLKIYFMWLIWFVYIEGQPLPQKICERSEAIIENPILEKNVDILKIKYDDGVITVTNLGSQKIKAMQMKIQYEKSNHH